MPFAPLHPSFSPYLERGREYIFTDSRLVQKGGLFFAIPCPQVLHHIHEALEHGASTVVVESDGTDTLQGQYQETKHIIFVPNVRKSLSQCARALYPKQPKVCVAITGTNGKTSVAEFFRQFVMLCGKKSASVGTLGLVGIEQANDPLPSLTTLDSLTLHRVLQEASDQSVEYLALEASSHGLDQYRLDAVNLDAAGFTNLTHDHLDYHLSFESYFEAKLRLFTDILNPPRPAILNKLSSFYERLETTCKSTGHKIMSYGNAHSDIHIIKAVSHPQGLNIDLYVLGKIFRDVPAHIWGEFQLENLQCALGLCLACGFSANDLVSAIPHLRAPMGRLEPVYTDSQNRISIFIDYAHTPDALQKALQSLRPTTTGNLWVVFGCGGNRDSQKRPLMGDIACRYADKVIVTDDNPRFEDPDTIRAAIKATCAKAHDIGDRKKAIHTAISSLKPGDSLLIAGKGHESGQTIQDITLPMLDHDLVREVLEALSSNSSHSFPSAQDS